MMEQILFDPQHLLDTENIYTAQIALHWRHGTNNWNQTILQMYPAPVNLY